MTVCCSVYDMAAKRFLDPFFGPTLEFALRGFREACTTPGHQFEKFPEDYALYHVANFDPETGTLEAMVPNKIAVASQLVRESQPQLIQEVMDA